MTSDGFLLKVSSTSVESTKQNKKTEREVGTLLHKLKPIFIKSSVVYFIQRFVEDTTLVKFL